MRRTTLVMIAILAVFASVVSADVVTVTPDNMQGWSIEAYRLGTGGIVPYGPATTEGGTPWNSKEDGNGTELGRGAFYATCDTVQGCCGAGGANKTPSTVWIGTDSGAGGSSYVGIELSRITRLTYYVFVSQNPWRTAAGTNWEDYTSWRCPRQPIMLALTVVAPDGTDRRTFYCRPWGSATLGDDNCTTYFSDRGATKGRWEYHNCLLIGRVPGPAWGTWWDPWGNTRLSWNDIAGPDGMFRNYKLAPTSNDPWPTGYKSPGWDDTTDPPGTPHTVNGTGKCINLMVGGRSRKVKFSEDGVTGSNWQWEGAGFRGHVDQLTIGIDNVDTTFDFEPVASDKQQTVVINGGALKDPLGAAGSVASNDPELRATQDCFRFKGCGPVRACNEFEFTVNLGSPLPYIYGGYEEGNGVRVCTWPNEHGVTDGDTWAVSGYMERLRFGTDVPIMCWADINHCKKMN